MLSNDIFLLYKRDLKKSGFKNKKNLFYKKNEKITFVIKFENVKNGNYEVYIGTLINEQMTKEYPLIRSDGWLFYLRLKNINKQNPSSVVNLALEYFEQMKTIDALKQFIFTNSLFYNIDRDALVQQLEFK